MFLIDHPEQYREGTRVVMLCSRRKDGLDNGRRVLRVTHTAEQFTRAVQQMAADAHDWERIYASAGDRAMSKAIREFKRRQLDADYEGQVEHFYQTLNERWASCLMAPTSQGGKVWLFVCDTGEQAKLVEEALTCVYDRTIPPYAYPTKNGVHILVQPFNRGLLSPAVDQLIQLNPMMLWGY